MSLGSRRGALASVVLLVLGFLAPGAFAAYYTAETAPFNWISTAGHTQQTKWSANCKASNGTGDALGDDSLSASNIALGFGFNYGGIAYTTVRIHTNGRIQFSNSSCGAVTKVAGPPRTYALAYPNSTLTKSMKIYGADLDVSTAGSGTITYKSTGTAPNRIFVVSWNNVRAWKSSTAFGAGTSYNLQIQLYENGEFYYQYGVNDDVSEPLNQAMGPAEIGWEYTATIYEVKQQGLPANNSAFRFYKKSGLLGLSEYRFEETTLTGATGEIINTGNGGVNGTRINSPTTTQKLSATANGKICRGIDVPSNATLAQKDAVDTGLSPATIGNAGAITFWYKSNSAWNVEDNALFDATATNGKWFYLAKTIGGQLRFVVSDNAATTVLLTLAPSTTLSVAAQTWKHIAVTWSLATAANTSKLQIYVDGVLYGSVTGSTNGSLRSSLGSLYLGDLRGTASDIGTTPYSANGTLDEVHLYARVLTAAEIALDMATVRSCAGTDHFAVVHDGTAVTCQAELLVITAHLADHSAANAYIGTVTLTTSTGHGDWSLQSGLGSLNNGVANDGTATYGFLSGDAGTALLTLKNTLAETLNINVSDGVLTERSGAAIATEDANLLFADVAFQFEADDTANTIRNQIAGKSSAVAPGAQNITLQAIKTSDRTGTCETGLVGTLVVSLAAECVSPTTCAGGSFSISGGTPTTISSNVSGAVNAYTPTSLTFDGTGSAPLSVTYTEAGSSRLHAKYTLPLGSGGGASGTVMSGSSNTFVWRPFAFEVKATGNPAAYDAYGGKFTTAGTTFNGTARAVVWRAADDADANGIADGMTSSDVNPANNAALSDNPTTTNYAPGLALTLSSTLSAPVGGMHPGLGGAPTATFSGGTASISGLRYDETGIIEITAAQSGNYLGIGTSETSAIRGASGYVGRFYPKRFSITANTPVVANRCVAGSFTYQDQPFYFSTAPTLTLTALNALGLTSSNYTTTGFFKLPTTLAGRTYANTASGSHTLLATTTSGVTLTGATNGAGSVSLALATGAGGDTFNYPRGAPEAPFSASFTASFPATALTDTDGVCYDSDDNGVCEVFATGNITGAKLRYGRLKANNALGSELEPLAVPVYAQYYNGSGFVVNSADSCTVIGTSALDFGAGTYSATPAAGVATFSIGSGSSTATLGTAALSAGQLGLSLSAPGSRKVGEIDYQINLTTAASTWLQFDWDNNGTLTDNPTGRASFGLYAGPKRIIFRRDQW